MGEFGAAGSTDFLCDWRPTMAAIAAQKRHLSENELAELSTSAIQLAAENVRPATISMLRRVSKREASDERGVAGAVCSHIQ